MKFIHVLYVVIILFLLTGCGSSSDDSGVNDTQNLTLPPINGGDVPIAGLFKDVNLQACIESEASTQFLTDPKANQLTGIIRCNDKPISDITGINNLVNISGLTISGAGLSNISPIKDMANLTSLTLTANNISDISVLSSLPNLFLLNLDQNNILDISPLKDLTKLTILRLSINSISDVTALSGLTGLVDLGLSNNNIMNVGPLGSLLNLTGLSVHSNRIGGMGVGNVINLVALTKLDSLRIFSNQNMSCIGLQTLITTFTGITILIPSTAVDGVDCTSP